MYIELEMICNVRTCDSYRYLEEPDDQSFEVFLADCQHAKCKVVRLVRQQISKLHNTQYFLVTKDVHCEAHDRMPDEVYETYSEEYEMHDDMQEPYSNEIEGDINQMHGEMHEAQETSISAGQIIEAKNVATPAQRSASPDRVKDRKWILTVLDRLRRRARLILAAVAVGMIAWTALIYGVFLGATVCGNGRTCSLKYPHAKPSLF